jgi:hypothetical protein
MVLLSWSALFVASAIVHGRAARRASQDSSASSASGAARQA